MQPSIGAALLGGLRWFLIKKRVLLIDCTCLWLGCHGLISFDSVRTGYEQGILSFPFKFSIFFNQKFWCKMVSPASFSTFKRAIFKSRASKLKTHFIGGYMAVGTYQVEIYQPDAKWVQGFQRLPRTSFAKRPWHGACLGPLVGHILLGHISHVSGLYIDFTNARLILQPSNAGFWRFSRFFPWF